ncbi:eukaryotic translation initiation factor 4E-binding protein 2 [Antennarius striatus]|uniref:eukaryotic translation initiation factor 4E-binding protein 2 n=1 Tax=Antennarius striatus TaxID=241820 RepID=UPI0035B26B01
MEEIDSLWRPLKGKAEWKRRRRRTRIIYDRKFLLDRRNSPIAQTPPAHLPVIPGVTSQNVQRENQKNEANNHINNHDGKSTNGDDAQFEMDI